MDNNKENLISNLNLVTKTIIGMYISTRVWCFYFPSLALVLQCGVDICRGRQCCLLTKVMSLHLYLIQGTVAVYLNCKLSLHDPYRMSIMYYMSTVYK